MKPRLLLQLVAASFALAGCAYNTATVPVYGAPRDIARLAGEWEGDYFSNETQRSGLITFQIADRGDSASGDVQMFLPDRRQLMSADRYEQHGQRLSSANFLTITFVAVAGGKVEGRLEPYNVPDCECTAYTIFTGTVQENRINGVFMTVTSTHEVQRGKWQVKRRILAKR